MTLTVAAIGDAILSKLTFSNVAALVLLLSSCVLASGIMYFRIAGRSVAVRDFVRFAFPREVLKHPSAQADFLFWITRRMLMPILFLPSGLAMVVATGWLTHRFLTIALGAGHHTAGPVAWPTLCLFTGTMLLAYDLSYYLYHVAQHRFPILWELHKVHHSAEVMVGVTKDRIHPLDEIMNRLWDGFVVGMVYGVWLFVALDPIELTIFGINVYVMRNILMMDFVRHTHLKVSFGRVGNAIVLCPHYHQLHHSTDPQHHDKNFGLMLSVWDRVFGTLAVPRPGESFSFGLHGEDSRAYQSLSGLYWLPLRRMAARAISWRRHGASVLPTQRAS